MFVISHVDYELHVQVHVYMLGTIPSIVKEHVNCGAPCVFKKAVPIVAFRNPFVIVLSGSPYVCDTFAGIDARVLVTPK